MDMEVIAPKMASEKAERPIDRALRWARTEKGWNQVRFAESFGGNRQDITNWKDRGMPADRHEAIAQILGHTVDELVGRVPERQQDPFLDALLEIWRDLARRHRRDVLKHARYLHFKQAPDEEDPDPSDAP